MEMILISLLLIQFINVFSILASIYSQRSILIKIIMFIGLFFELYYFIRVFIYLSIIFNTIEP